MTAEQSRSLTVSLSLYTRERFQDPSLRRQNLSFRSEEHQRVDETKMVSAAKQSTKRKGKIETSFGVLFLKLERDTSIDRARSFKLT